MQLELGKIYEGKVTGIKDYGAFVEIVGENVTGMVHISQISNEYVSNAKDHLTEGQIVKVKFIGTNDDGKIKLSIKDTLPSEPRKYNPQQRRNNNGNNSNNTNSGSSNNNYNSNSNNNYQKRNNNNYNNNTPNRNNGNYSNNTSNRNNYNKNNDNQFNKKSESERFEDMLNKFKQHSDENLNDLKKITDRRNRSRRK